MQLINVPSIISHYFKSVGRAGVLQHVMVRGIERRDILIDDRDRSDLVERLSSLLLKTRTDCLAW